jgi:F0F1-type ATP synthase membrane subunit c/vacuolar-type H+-ATPase subunit K
MEDSNALAEGLKFVGVGLTALGFLGAALGVGNISLATHLLNQRL